MVGTFINTGAIVLGGVAGLTFARHLTSARQQKLRLVLAILTVYVAASTMWDALDGYGWGMKLKLFGVTLVSLVVGNAIGMALRLQSGLNRIGNMVQSRLQRGPESGTRFSEGLVTTTLLFCVGPMAIIGTTMVPPRDSTLPAPASQSSTAK